MSNHLTLNSSDSISSHNSLTTGNLSSSSILHNPSSQSLSSSTRDPKRPREEPVVGIPVRSKKLRTSAMESSTSLSSFRLTSSTNKKAVLLLDDFFLSSPTTTSNSTCNINNDTKYSTTNKTHVVAIDSKRETLLDDQPNWEGLSRHEILTLILQSLSSLGYHSSREVLEFESGTQLEAPDIQALHQQVLNGQWDQALHSISEMTLELSQRTRQWGRFIIMEQQFIELIREGRSAQALERLRKFLVPSAQFDSRTRGRTRKLCSLLMLKGPKALRHEAFWKESTAKRNVWRQLLEFLPSDHSPPPMRLATLLHQAIRFQELQCVEHGAIQSEGFTTPSLLHDHCCSPNRLPSYAFASLEGHSNEVWFVSISNDGKYIASGSADKSVILWQVNLPEIRLVRRYSQYDDSISYMSWSSDSQLLATSTVGGDIKVWDVSCESEVPYAQAQTQPDSPRNQRNVSRQHLKPSTSVVAWVPNERQLLAASGNRKVLHFALSQTPLNCTKLSKHLFKCLNCWVFRKAVQDIGITSCGKYVAVSLSDKTVRVLPLNFDPRKDCDEFHQLVFEESDIVTSLCVSSLRPQFLVSVSEDRPVIRLWDISTGRVLQRYRGHQQGHFVLKASFGGRDENFVVSGSEDSRIFIWNRLYGSLVVTLSGHSSTVNSVHWPAGMDWMASASDDHRILVWHASDKSVPNIIVGKSSSASLYHVSQAPLVD